MKRGHVIKILIIWLLHPNKFFRGIGKTPKQMLGCGLETTREQSSFGDFTVNFEHIQQNDLVILLTHVSPVFHFYTPWKRQKTFGV